MGDAVTTHHPQFRFRSCFDSRPVRLSAREESVAMSDTAAVIHGEHSHEHQPNLQHHFATYEQQMDCGKLGMWLFLATEILLFGGLFVGFGMMQAKYPLDFIAAHHHLNKNLGFLNTV